MAGLVSPLYDPELEKITRQQALAEQLRQKGLEGASGGGYQGGPVYIRANPFGNIAQGLIGAFTGARADQQAADLDTSRTGAFNQFMASRPELYDQNGLPKTAQQIQDEQQQWIAQAGENKSPLVQAIRQQAVLKGLDYPEKMMAAEATAGLARQKLEEQKAQNDIANQMRQQGLDIHQQAQQSMAETQRQNRQLQINAARQKQADQAAKDNSALSIINIGRNAIKEMIGARDEGGMLLPGAAPHPGFSSYVGWGLPFASRVPGRPEVGASKLQEQIRGVARLEGIEQIRGTGTVSNAEGEAAASALTRLHESTTEDDYIKAAQEFDKFLKASQDRFNRRVRIDPETQEEISLADYNKRYGLTVGLEDASAQPSSGGSQAPAADQIAPLPPGMGILRTGTKNGRKVVQGVDGRTYYAE